MGARSFWADFSMRTRFLVPNNFFNLALRKLETERTSSILKPDFLKIDSMYFGW